MPAFNELDKLKIKHMICKSKEINNKNLKKWMSYKKQLRKRVMPSKYKVQIISVKPINFEFKK